MHTHSTTSRELAAIIAATFAPAEIERLLWVRWLYWTGRISEQVTR